MDARSTAALALALVTGCASPKPAALLVDPPAAMTPTEPNLAPPPAPTKDYPASRRDDVVDTIHGTAVADPYRWLEDPSTPEVQAWMTAQDAYARAHLATLPGHDALARRLAEVFYFDAIGEPTHRGSRFFYSRKRKDQEKAVIYWTEGEHGAEQVLLDPSTWSTDGSAGLRGWWPSWDGKRVAYKRSEHNADEATLFVQDVATGKALADVIPGTKYGDVSWTPDGKGFYYTWVPDPSDAVSVAARPGFAEIRYHAIGTDPAKDPTIRARTGDPATFVNAQVSADGHWLLSSVMHGWNSSDWYVKDLRKPRADWTTLVAGVDANFDVVAFKDVFYVHTNDGAPRYRVFAVDAKHVARSAWKEIVPERDATLEAVSLIGGSLVLTYLRNAASEVEVHDLRGALVHTIAIPALGSASPMTGLATDDTGYLRFTSFSEPQVIYQASVKAGTAKVWAKVELPVDTSQIVTEQVHYPSKDGTSISMFLVHRKDAVKNGANPVFLTGYGGFNVPALPGFVSSRSSWGAHAVWLEHGGMIAVPNLRGGGEYGEDWHRAGMLLQKQHVFDDFLGAARYLIDSGWTSPAHLAISGGSNGGLLMGAAITQGPSLFKAVVCEVPLLDMVRYHLSGSGATWTSEYGSADDPAQFAALYAYSPYHHVTEGTHYPAVLMSSSDHDDRVDPMHARKFAAALQWATAGDAPVWLRIQRNAGHSGADMVRQRVEQVADSYAFLMWQLGMK